MEAVTIDLEPDAYEKLRALRQPGESWSEVVRRMTGGAETRTALPYPSPAALEAQRQAIMATAAKVPVTGAMLLEYYRNGGSGFSEENLDSVEANAKNKREMTNSHSARKNGFGGEHPDMGTATNAARGLNLFGEPAFTTAQLLEYLRSGGSGASEEYLNEVEAADKNDQPPDDSWA